LTGLALLAGYDWVWYEPDANNHHLHVSQNPSFTADFGASAISDALDWGRQHGLVASTQLYNTLNGLIQAGEKKSVSDFIQTVKKSSNAEMNQSFAALLRYNAEKLKKNL
jgi:hypothetical protein